MMEDLCICLGPMIYLRKIQNGSDLYRWAVFSFAKFENPDAVTIGGACDERPEKEEKTGLRLWKPAILLPNTRVHIDVIQYINSWKF